MLYRPSPQIPRPSPEAAARCYEAAAFNIDVMKQQLHANVVDFTWILTQTLFMQLNTILWCLSYPTIRQKHPADEVMIHVTNALESLDHASGRWPGVRSARQLYDNLIVGCFKAYDNDYSSPPMIGHPSPASFQETCTSSSQSASYYNSPSSTGATSLARETSPSSFVDTFPGFMSNTFVSESQPDVAKPPIFSSGPSATTSEASRDPFSPAAMQQTENTTYPSMQSSFDLPEFNLLFQQTNSGFALPTSQPWSLEAASTRTASAYYGQGNISPHQQSWLGSFGDEYSRYTQQTYFPSSHQLQPLSEKQQNELMATLERDQLPDVSELASESTTFYNPHLA